MIRISVVIPALNAEKTIRSCLESVFNQTIPHETYEIIVVDNGSTDATAEIIHSFPAISIYEPKRNRGTARNAGIRAAKGDLIAFLDADMRIDPSWLETMAQCFTSQSIGGVQSLIRLNRSYPEGGDLEFQLGSFFHLPFIFSGACMFRKTALIDGGLFSEDLYRHEDTDLSWKVLRAGWIFVSTKEAVAETGVPNSLSLSSEFQMGAGMAQILYRWRKFLGVHYATGLVRAIQTWAKGWKPDVTLPPHTSFCRFILRALSLSISAPFIPLLGFQAQTASKPMPPLHLHDEKNTYRWHSGTRIAFTHDAVRLIQIEDHSLLILQGSGYDFFWELVHAEFEWEKALASLQHRFPSAEDIREDFIELRASLLESGIITP